MKKFYLLLALVLMAGVVHAQDESHFGDRTRLPKAKRAICRVSCPETYEWNQDNKDLDVLFTDVQTGSHVENGVTIYNIESGQTMASTYENFVIRVSGLSEGGVYSVQFLDNNGDELHTFTYWTDDVHISPLRSLFSEEQINNIHKVKLIGKGSSGKLTLEEAYFISAYKGLSVKDEKGVYVGYTDNDHIDICNAYIDPSYLIRSNRMWVEINQDDRSFEIFLKK